MFLASAEVLSENLGFLGVAFFFFVVAEQDFCFQPEGGARSVTVTWNQLSCKVFC